MKLLESLCDLSNSEKMPFDKIKRITENGIYVVYRNRKAIYVGSSGTESRARMAELDNHFRTHTLHRKLLQRELGLESLPTKIRTDNQLIELVREHRLNSAEAQDKVNRAKAEIKKMIRTKFRYRFYKMERANKAHIQP